MVDVVEEYLGLPSSSDELKAEDKERALAIVKLTNLPEWKVFEKFLDDSFKKCDQGCEVYSVNHSLAILDTGKKHQIELIKQFIDTQIKIIEKYVEDKTKSHE